MTIPTGPRHRVSRVEARGVQAPRPDRSAPPRDDTDLERLLALVARGDQDAFEALYDKLSGPAYGLVRKVLRDPAQSEEVTQEVMLAGEHLDAIADLVRRLVGQVGVVRGGQRADVARRAGQILADHRALAVLDAGHVVELPAVPVRAIERQDRADVVEERVGVPQLGLEVKRVGDVVSYSTSSPNE